MSSPFGDVQALLDEWRAEAARKPLGMTEAEACQVLEVSLAEDQELDDEMLKAAYRYGFQQWTSHDHSLRGAESPQMWLLHVVLIDLTPSASTRLLESDFLSHASQSFKEVHYRV